MRERFANCRTNRVAVLLAAVVLVLQMGGCPIDTSNLIADVVTAALQSASASLVEALKTTLP